MLIKGGSRGAAVRAHSPLRRKTITRGYGALLPGKNSWCEEPEFLYGGGTDTGQIHVWLWKSCGQALVCDRTDMPVLQLPPHLSALLYETSDDRNIQMER